MDSWDHVMISHGPAATTPHDQSNTASLRFTLLLS